MVWDYILSVGKSRGVSACIDCSIEAVSTPDTIPATPQNLVISAGDAKVTLTWSAPTNDGGVSITNYKIYRGTTSGSETSLTNLGNVLTYSDSNLTDGQTYYYRVSAVNSVGESGHTEEVSAIPYASTTDGGDNTWLYIGIGVVIITVIAVAVTLFLRRPK